MKKCLCLLLAFILTASLFAGCKSPESIATLSVNIAEQPYTEDKIVKIGDADSLEIVFNLDKAGYIKLYAFDATDYDEWPSYVNTSKLTFTDEKGKTLYEFEDVSGGYSKATRFEAGTVTAKLTFDERFENMNQVCLGWAFAPDTDDAQAVTVDGGTAFAKIGKDKHAYFTFTVNENGLYQINCGEACVFESDSKFTLESADGATIASDVFIHETEWWSRKVFLTAGEYKLTTSDIENVARCSVKRQEEQPGNVLTEVPKKMILATSPIAIGFVKTEGQVIEATFKAGSSNRLQINADGLGTFYDSEQSFDLVITNSRGKVVLEEEYCESGMYDISSFKGEHKIKLTPHGNGIYQLCLTTYNPED